MEDGRAFPHDYLEYQAMDEALVEKVRSIKLSRWLLDHWGFRFYDRERPPYTPTDFVGAFHTEANGHVLAVAVTPRDITYNNGKLDWKEVTDRVSVVTVSVDDAAVLVSGNISVDDPGYGRVGYVAMSILEQLVAPHLAQFVRERERIQQAEQNAQDERRREAEAKARSILDRL